METRLQCVSPDAARAVAMEADLPEQNHRAEAEGSVVVLTYTDKRYPLDVPTGHLIRATRATPRRPT